MNMYYKLIKEHYLYMYNSVVVIKQQAKRVSGGVESGRMEALTVPFYGRVDPISRVTFHKHRVHIR